MSELEAAWKLVQLWFLMRFLRFMDRFQRWDNE